LTPVRGVEDGILKTGEKKTGWVKKKGPHLPPSSRVGNAMKSAGCPTPVEEMNEKSNFTKGGVKKQHLKR